jgi:hypothetical protein
MINHIRKIHDETKSWCGEIIGAGDACLKTIDAAALNGAMSSETESCHECINIIIGTLKKSQAGRQYK